MQKAIIPPKNGKNSKNNSTSLRKSTKIPNYGTSTSSSTFTTLKHPNFFVALNGKDGKLPLTTAGPAIVVETLNTQTLTSLSTGTSGNIGPILSS